MFIKTINMKVKELMISKDKFPQVKPDDFLKLALDMMTDYNLGIVCVVDQNTLKGVITDGDIRRKLLNVQKPFSAFFTDYAIDHSISKPITCSENDTLKFAIELMEKKQIWDLPVIDDNGNLSGLLHLHAAIKNFI
jgi:DeoR family transcriptional regulator, catabolite repression regulator|tara:strand:+ start:169 stop:576 length:408 start_codon:yes stop_codon:yes gene_type:complete